MNDKIESKDISVVVQGAVSDATKNCLESIRKFLPDSQIILSTWEDSEVDGLDFDFLALSRDPGHAGLIRRFPHKHYNPINRILVGAKAGIAKVERQYCLKLRTDALLVSAEFLKYYNKYAHKITEESVVKKRIMVEGLMTSLEACYSVSDWWYLGLTEDIKLLFDAPLYEIEEIPYFERKENHKKAPVGSDIVCRYKPEQYVFYQFVKRTIPLSAQFENFSHFYHLTEENKAFYRKYIALNTITLEHTLSGITLPKYAEIKETYFRKHAFTLQNWRMNYAKLQVIPFAKNLKWYRGRTSSLRDDMFHACLSTRKYADLSTIQSFDEKEKLKSSDITFVVAGLILEEGEFATIHCLRSIRCFYPDSTIILTTWKGQDISGIDDLFEECLILDIPKEKPAYANCEGHPLSNKPYTVNRQQFMMHTALLKVKTEYCVRLRSDYVLTRDKMIQYYETFSTVFSKSDARYQFLQNRILTHNFFMTRPDLVGGGFSFAVSDCFHFGKTEDLLKLWDGHQETYSDLTYFRNGKNKHLNNIDMLGSRYNAEQSFLMSPIKKYLPFIELPTYYRDNEKHSFIFESQKVIVSNFLIGNSEQIGLKCKFDQLDPAVLYSLTSFFQEYLLHIAPDCQKSFEQFQQHILTQEKINAPEIKYSLIKKILGKIKGYLFKCREFPKRILRVISPTYRVTSGVRQRLMEFEIEEMHRFHRLEHQNEEIKKSLKELKVKLVENKEATETTLSIDRL